MKKYIKPSIETIEANLSADCLQEGGVSQVHNAVGNGQLAPGKKGSSDAWEDEDDFGW